MSVKHLEYLKVKDSKLLVVEVRPVKCLLDTPSGPTYTDKWMDHSHWKELHHLLAEIVDEYEELRVNRNVKCNEPKCKTSKTLHMGYMFRPLPQCWCSLYFLTPRTPCTLTQDDDDDDTDDLKDKGGRHEDLTACGEMLVVSVILRDTPESSTQSSHSQSFNSYRQQYSVNNKLMVALGSKKVNTVSNYFSPVSGSEPSSSGEDIKKEPLSRRQEKGKSSSRIKTYETYEKKTKSGTHDEDVLRSGGVAEDVGCGPQDMRWTTLCHVISGREESVLKNNLQNGILSKRIKEENVEGNTWSCLGDESQDTYPTVIPETPEKVETFKQEYEEDGERYMELDPLSCAFLTSPSSAENPSPKTILCNSRKSPDITEIGYSRIKTENEDTDPCFNKYVKDQTGVNDGESKSLVKDQTGVNDGESKSLVKDQTGVNDGESKSLHRIDKEYEHQNNKREKEKQMPKICSRSSADVRRSSGAVEMPFFHKNIGVESVKSLHSTHEHVHSSLKKRDEVNMDCLCPFYTPKKDFLSQSNEESVVAKKSRISAEYLEDSHHSTQDLMEENSDESLQDLTNSLSSRDSQMSEECVSLDAKLSESPNSEQGMNLRRSERISIKKNSPGFKNVNFFDPSEDEFSEPEYDWKEKDISPHSKKSNEYSDNHTLKKKLSSGVLKQTKIMKFTKSNNILKKECEPAQLETLKDKTSNKKESCKQHKAVRKKSSPQKATKKTSKPSTSKQCEASSSKQGQTSKTQDSKKMTEEVWNFFLPSEPSNTKAKTKSNGTKQKNKKSPVKKTQTQSGSSKNLTKGKEKKTEKKTETQQRKKSSKSDVENCPPDIANDTFYWKIQDEVDKINALVLNDSDEEMPLTQTSDPDKPSRSGRSKNKGNQSPERKNSCEEECSITYEMNGSKYSSEALRDTYRQLQNMTQSDLKQRLDENIPYLEDVIRGVVPNQRHQWFKENSCELRMQEDFVIYGPFTSEQSLYVLDLLKEKLSHMDSLIGNIYHLPLYRCHVLVPTFFTKILMDNNNITLKEAYRLMVKFSSDPNIA